MFNLGPMELAVILVLALLVFGPKKLPEIGKGVGQAMREFKRASRDLMDSFNESLEDRPRPVTDTYASPSAAEPIYPYEPAAIGASPDEPAAPETEAHPANGSSEVHPGSDGLPSVNGTSKGDGGSLDVPGAPIHDEKGPVPHDPPLIAAASAEPDLPSAPAPERTT
jgi:sec-independent protein translocase protein TatA